MSAEREHGSGDSTRSASQGSASAELLTLLLRTRDPLVEGRVARVAARLGVEARPMSAADEAAAEPEGVAGVLVGLDLDGALEAVRLWRQADPELPVVAYLPAPDPQLWSSAESAGADLVTSRGRADRELERLVGDRLSGRRRARRVRLASYKDFAGRLGYVGRLAETPAGPIAVYQLGHELHAVADACPHAGASLCEGELEGDVITCPRHGSQFRVTDGERVRGPADSGLATFRVLVESGDVYVEVA